MDNKKIVQRIVVGGVLINKENKALILQRNANEKVYPNLWELPSGKKEPLEETENALIREFKEETGLSVSVISTISVFDYVIEKSNEIRDSIQINFLVKLLEENEVVSLSEDHQDYTWVGIESLDELNLTDSTKLVLKKAFLNLK